jgi:adenine-specific DNA-methyltransferase
MKPYYQDDAVTLYNARWQDIVPTLPAESVPLVVTSPMFNIGGRMSQKRNVKVWDMSAEWYVDDMPQAEYEAEQERLLTELARTLAKDGSIAYNHRPRPQKRKVLHPLDWIRRATAVDLVQEIIWHRNGGPLKNCGLFFPTYEVLYWLGRSDGKARWPNKGTDAWGNVWRIDFDTEAPWHPCAFPRELAGRCIAALSSPGETVLDPFAGACTVGVEARRLGRKAILIEAREDYCARAAIRLTQQAMNLEVG